MKNKRIVFTSVWLTLGIALTLCGMLGIIDSYWYGMGGGMIGVGIVHLVRYIRYQKDEEYRETMDVQNKDERNKFLAGKAWAWAGNLYVILSGIAVVVLRIAGYEELSVWTAYSVCLIVVLYWLSYLFLQKKY